MEIHGTTKKGKTLLGYYLSLFVLTIFLSRPNVAYGEVLRLGYLALLVIPLFVSKKYSIAAFTTFVGISFNSFYPMLPSIYTPYVLIAFTIMYPLAGIRMNRLTIPIIFLFFAIREYLCIDINIEFLVWGFVAIMLSTKINTEEDVKHLMISFIFVSFFLSFMLLLYASFFMSVYSIDDNLERVGWINQNLFGGTVGLGTAAMVMAVVSHQTGIPLEKLDFRRIKSLEWGGIDEPTVAIIMALVSHQTGIPLERLDFKSIKLIEE